MFQSADPGGHMGCTSPGDPCRLFDAEMRDFFPCGWNGTTGMIWKNIQQIQSHLFFLSPEKKPVDASEVVVVGRKTFGNLINPVFEHLSAHMALVKFVPIIKIRENSISVLDSIGDHRC